MATISALDMFTIGIGPSSSHTVGPMRAAKRFIQELDACGTLARVARARALLQGRAFVLPEDLKHLAPSVLGHRLVLDARARYSGAEKRELLREILKGVPVPR